MIRSCRDCTNKCCKIGPGPYKKLDPENYLETCGDALGYNTVCNRFDQENGRCTLWGTKDFPSACAGYVCQIREFSSEEIKRIAQIGEPEPEYACSCGCKWGYWKGHREYECSNCGNVFGWTWIGKKQ